MVDAIIAHNSVYNIFFMHVELSETAASEVRDQYLNNLNQVTMSKEFAKKFEEWQLKKSVKQSNKGLWQRYYNSVEILRI